MQRHAIALCTHSLATQKDRRADLRGKGYMRGELKNINSMRSNEYSSHFWFDLAFLVWEVAIHFMSKYISDQFHGSFNSSNGIEGKYLPA